MNGKHRERERGREGICACGQSYICLALSVPLTPPASPPTPVHMHSKPPGREGGGGEGCGGGLAEESPPSSPGRALGVVILAGKGRNSGNVHGPSPALFASPRRPLAWVSSSAWRRQRTDNGTRRRTLPRSAQKSPPPQRTHKPITHTGYRSTSTVTVNAHHYICTTVLPHLTIIHRLSGTDPKPTRNTIIASDPARLPAYNCELITSSTHARSPHLLHRNGEPFRRNLLIFFKEKKPYKY